MQRTNPEPTAPHYRWVRPSFIESPWLRWGLLILGVAYLVWATSTLSISWDRVARGLPRAADIFSRAWPPNFSRQSLIISGFVESIQIAIFATALGILISVPAALLAARNIVPKVVYLFGRGLIIVARSFHPVIVAILFVKAVGFGPLAGVLTLMIYSIGFVGKLLAEAIEEIDEGQVEALRATGAGTFKVLMYAVFPQILPRQVGLSIYQFDSNLRASAVVGVVGAGGIGGTLMIYSIGFVGKLLAEAIEEIDEGQVEALRATGAGTFKVLMYAVFPQILPRQVGLSIYQFDSNLRASAVVGVVGAGGIGGTLMNAFRRFDYDFALAILLVIIAIILVSEAVSGRLRSQVT